METFETPEFIPQASVYHVYGKWVICSHAFYRGSAGDESGYNEIVADPVTDTELGSKLRLALATSRMLPLEEVRSYFSLEQLTPRYERWVAWVMAGTGAKSRKAVFRGLKSCSVQVTGGRFIEIKPLRRDGPEGWSGMGQETTVSILLSVADAEVGAALRLADGRALL